MNLRLTQAELDAMPAKTKKDPAVVALYLEHDFQTAYAKHTDRRVLTDGPRGAVGAFHDWERHGDLQFCFLVQQGLRPSNRLLEIGCGTGRLARKIVPYLDADCYVGVDISTQALLAARDLAVEEDWDAKRPAFRDSPPPESWLPYDFVWAFSVFIHLPAHLMEEAMKSVAKRLAPGGRFLFSYVPERADARTGLKQFRHTLETYHRAASSANLTFADVPAWTGEQRIAVSTCTQ